MSIDKVAIVVPCYNEALRFDAAYFQQIMNISQVRLFFVNDGSKDDTVSVLNGFSLNSGGRVLDLVSNVGKANAIRLGMLSVISDLDDFEADAIGFLDADAAFDIQSVLDGIKVARRLLNEGYDIIISSRVSLCGRKITRKTYRHIIGRFIVTILGLKFKDVPYDPQSGFKIFRVQSSFEKSLEMPFSTHWFGDIEMLHRLYKFSPTTPKIWEEPAHAWQDVRGSNITIRGSLQILIELIRVMRLKYE
jgi:glycosyltransferase involved in cell wall biosynthesis